MLVVRFTPELARVPARSFVSGFLHEKLRLREIYVGKGFVFGQGRQGNLDLLQEMGSELGFVAHGVDEVIHGGERISSTRIRRAIAEGNTAEAAELLSRPYSITGSIARGDRMGQKLGWPTINIMPDNKLLPADGVYAGPGLLPELSGDLRLRDQHRHPADGLRELPAGGGEPHPGLQGQRLRPAGGAAVPQATAGGADLPHGDGPLGADRPRRGGHAGVLPSGGGWNKKPPPPVWKGSRAARCGSLRS